MSDDRSIVARVRDLRQEHIRKKGVYADSPSTRINSIPRYDWYRDPDGLLQNGLIPKGRCFHCGWQFNNPTTSEPDPNEPSKMTPDLSAGMVFCIVCFIALSMNSVTITSRIGRYIIKRTRIEGTEPKTLIPTGVIPKK